MSNPLNPNSTAFRQPQFTNITLPGERLNREAVLRAATIGGAQFLRADKDIGSLEKGKLGDMIVLDKDYFLATNQEIGLLKVLLTVVGGESYFESDDAHIGTTPKYPNNAQDAVALETRMYGGPGGRLLPREQRGMGKRGKGACAGHTHD